MSSPCSCDLLQYLRPTGNETGESLELLHHWAWGQCAANYPRAPRPLKEIVSKWGKRLGFGFSGVVRRSIFSIVWKRESPKAPLICSYSENIGTFKDHSKFHFVQNQHVCIFMIFRASGNVKGPTYYDFGSTKLCKLIQAQTEFMCGHCICGEIQHLKTRRKLWKRRAPLNPWSV